MGDSDFRGAVFVLMVFAGLLGWAVIEGIIWLCHHVHISMS
jgi:hypothetical protein